MMRFVLGLVLFSLSVNGQNLLSELDSACISKEAGKKLVFATFKGNRLINHHTIETPGKRALDFRIAHRFDDMSKGVENFYGLDGPATVMLSFDYGITDGVSLGIGRTNVQKMAHLFLKYKLLKQTRDNNQKPVSITLLHQINTITEEDRLKTVNNFDKYGYFENRLSYFNQLIIARKFNEKASLQWSPIVIHQNLVELSTDENTIYAFSYAGRYKISKRVAITGEYTHTLISYSKTKSYVSPLSLGFDIETGGHVFQLFFSNAYQINEAQFVPYTTHDWGKREFRLGFNVSRVFGL